MNNWQPIETAPMNEDTIILAVHAETLSYAAVSFYSKNEGEAPLWWTLDGLGYMPEFFTHWMPIPPLPSLNQGNEK